MNKMIPVAIIVVAISLLCLPKVNYSDTTSNNIVEITSHSNNYAQKKEIKETILITEEGAMLSRGKESENTKEASVLTISNFSTVIALIISSFAAYVTYRGGIRTLKQRDFEFKLNVYNDIYRLLTDTQKEYLERILDEHYINNVKMKLDIKTYILFEGNVDDNISKLIITYAKNLASLGTGEKNDLSGDIKDLLIISYKRVIDKQS